MLAVFGLLVIASCSKDEEGAVKVATVEFNSEAQTVNENGSEITINIPFSRAAGKAGTITVTLAGTGVYATHYTTTPNGAAGSFNIEVSKGQTAAQFKLAPQNNSSLADDKTVILTIDEVSSGFEIGAKDVNTITILDDEGPTRANFTAATSSTAENLTAGVDVTVGFTNAAPGAGTVTVALSSPTAVYGTHFTTEPAATAGKIQIAVSETNPNVKFKVKPIDDGSVNAPRVITFVLESATGAIELGTTITTHTFTITDDETPSAVTFNEESSSVVEGNATGIDVPLTLDPQTNGTGTVGITFTGGTYGTDFTTVPEAAAGKITVNVATAATTASFKVIPVNNDATAANKVITFTISESAGVVTLGTADLTHALTIQDDDAVTTIAAVRAAYPGSTTNITSPVKIQGIVTSINPQVNGNNIFVQDATGAIVVRLVNPNNNAIERGDEITVQLNGGRYAEFSGSLQVELVPNANVTVIDQDNTLPTPEVITIAQLNSKDYESKLVRINAVAFVEANGTATMSGTKVVSDGTNTANVRTEPTAPHASSVQPYGFGTITGIASENGGAAQIIPMVFAEDVFTSSPTGSIGVTASFTDFGSVNTGEASASQSYTVQGTGLTADIVITASAGFKASLTDGGTYETTVAIPAASANSATTVYVKFFPTAGGAQTGTLTHKSLGTTPAVTSGLAGTGVGASPRQTLALWTFETSKPGGATNVTGTTISGIAAEEGLQSSTAVAAGQHELATTQYTNPAGNGSGESFSANGWSTNDYYEFSLSSTGLADVLVSWDQTRSGTGPSAFALYYSVNGTDFTKYNDYTVVQGTWAAAAPITTTSFSFDLSAITALNNSTTLKFRLVHTGTGIAATGTNRVDNFKVEAR